MHAPWSSFASRHEQHLSLLRLFGIGVALVVELSLRADSTLVQQDFDGMIPALQARSPS